MPPLVSRILFIVCLALVVGSAVASESKRFDGVPYPKAHFSEADEFFATHYIPQLRMEIDPANIEALKKNPHAYAHCTIYEGDVVYPDVAVHIKGGAGSFRPIDQKCAFTLNFDKYTRGQKFHGLDKLNLNNSVQDPSYTTEILCGEMFLAAGVPAVRGTHARLQMNGKEMGLYVLLESFDSVFLRKNFANWYGTLYDGGFLTDIDANLQKVSNDNRTDHGDLKELVKACQEPDPVKRREKMEKILEVDKFITFSALETIICHWDGYTMNKNNYRVYHDPTSDKLVFLPHGMDQMFGDPNAPMLPGQGMVSRVLTATAEDRKVFTERERKLFETVYNVQKLTNEVNAIAARLQPVLLQINTGEAKSQADQANWLNQRIVNRAKMLEKTLAAPVVVKTLPFDNGAAKLAGWAPKPEAGNPAPTLDAYREGAGTWLRIKVNGGMTNNTVASWRTKVTLEQGKYAFEGMVRTVSLPDSKDVNVGAAIRVSGGQRTGTINGSSNWKKMSVEFQVNDATSEVELVCELRANKGQAWFDPNSLKLVRK